MGYKTIIVMNDNQTQEKKDLLRNLGAELRLVTKSQYKKYIKDVVSGTLERTDLIEETVIKHLEQDIDLKKLINF